MITDCGTKRSNFYLLFFGGVAGVIPRRGGSGKPVGFGARGRLPPLYFSADCSRIPETSKCEKQNAALF
jgi:hypothetical protein